MYYNTNYRKSAVMGIMTDVAAELQQRDRMIAQLAIIMRPLETVEETLDRLLVERHAVCRLLDQSGAVKFDNPGGLNSGYRHIFADMVSRFLKPSKRDLRKKDADFVGEWTKVIKKIK